MMMMMTCAALREATEKIRVLCVDDNPMVTSALKVQLDQAPDMEWFGSACHADEMIERTRSGCPDIVLLDIDMPGRDPFEAIMEFGDLCRQGKVLMYTGLVRHDLVDKALESGAWGYVAKIDGQADLIEAIRAVNGGSLGFSRSIRNLLSQ